MTRRWNIPMTYPPKIPHVQDGTCMQIQAVDEKDLPQIISLTKKEYENIGFITPSAIMRDFTIVIKYGEIITAFCLYTISNKNKWIKISALVTSPQHRGNGLATELLKYVFYISDVLGLPIRINVAEDVPALSFWKKCGFVEISISDGNNSRKRKVLTLERQVSGENNATKI